MLPTTTLGIAPIVPLLKNTLSRASMNWSRTLSQYRGSPGSGRSGTTGAAALSPNPALESHGAAKPEDVTVGCAAGD
jgi:hypothetical protein